MRVHSGPPWLHSSWKKPCRPFGVDMSQIAAPALAAMKLTDAHRANLARYRAKNTFQR